MPKQVPFSVWLSIEERQLLVILAQHVERRQGDALRLALREAIRSRGLGPNKDADDGPEQLLHIINESEEAKLVSCDC